MVTCWRHHRVFYSHFKWSTLFSNVLIAPSNKYSVRYLHVRGVLVSSETGTAMTVDTDKGGGRVHVVTTGDHDAIGHPHAIVDFGGEARVAIRVDDFFGHLLKNDKK
jgi:hypothetical protein